MTTLVPLVLGCSGFALGLPGSPWVVGLVALGDVRGHWNGLLLIVGFMCHWRLQLADGFGPSAFIGVCCFCISVQCGRWCVVVVCIGGCGGACPSCVRVFGVCWVYWGLCWWGLFSVDADVFRCGWCGRSWVGLGAAVQTWNILVLDTYL